MISCWRICRKGYSQNAFSGKGASEYGGRWNRPGKQVVYTSSSIALAALEYLVNIEEEQIPDDLVVIRAEIPDDLKTESLDPGTLPREWRVCPAPESLADIGDEWLRRGRAAVLLAPSAVIPEERNYLMNPLHPDFDRIKIGRPKPFAMDGRLMKR